MPYIDPSIVAQAKRIDLLAYLQEREPDELVRIGPSAYATKTHDSLKISNGKWYWWSRGFGGKSALDYLIKVRGMAFTDAVGCLVGRFDAPLPAKAQAEKTSSEPKPFRLPPRHDDPSKVAAYLTGRGIDRAIVDECVQAGTLYESRRKGYSNAVFVGRDQGGVPRYAALRGCGGGFRGEIEGSDKRFSFRLYGNPANPEAHVFEAAIDALSYATMLKMRGRGWRAENLVSLGGVPPVTSRPGKESVPAALAQYLADNPGTATLRLHLDNDEAGLIAAAHISAMLSGSRTVSIEPPEIGKDVNDWLRSLAGRKQAARTGRER